MLLLLFFLFCFFCFFVVVVFFLFFFSRKLGLIFQVNCLLCGWYNWSVQPYFFEKYKYILECLLPLRMVLWSAKTSLTVSVSYRSLCQTITLILQFLYSSHFNCHCVNSSDWEYLNLLCKKAFLILFFSFLLFLHIHKLFFLHEL